jgi:hypothetical protein
MDQERAPPGPAAQFSSHIGSKPLSQSNGRSSCHYPDFLFRRPQPYIHGMVNNLSILRERLAEACRLRNTMFFNVCRGLFIAPNRAYQLELRPENLTIAQLVYIAGALDVSLDYLLGRTDDSEAHKPAPRKAKARA